MTEQLVMPAPESANREIDSLQSYEWGPRQDTPLHLGARAVELSHTLGAMRPVEQVDNYSRESEMHGAHDRPSNPEGSGNADLYKQAYDTAIESIERAFQADSLQLDDSLVAILASIDALSGVPYISSAPEFVALVNAARTNVEQVRSYIASGGSPEMDIAVANALSRARQQLAATTVAYRP